MSAGLFYFSFVDPSRPRGDRFVGATIVEGIDPKDAFETARGLGLVPKGGESAAVELWTQNERPQRRVLYPDMLPPGLQSRFWRRLGTRADVEACGGGKPLANPDAFICKDHSGD